MIQITELNNQIRMQLEVILMNGYLPHPVIEGLGDLMDMIEQLDLEHTKLNIELLEENTKLKSKIKELIDKK